MNLSKPQIMIYNMVKIAGDVIANNCSSMLIEGRREECELQRALNELFRINDALRFRLKYDSSEVYQEIADFEERNFDVLYFNDKDELSEYAEAYSQEVLDSSVELCDFKIVVLPEHFGLLVKLHHIISDAWTFGLLYTQYNNLLNNAEVSAYSYTDYLETEKAYADSKRYSRDREFFYNQIKSVENISYLCDKETTDFSTRRKVFILDSEKAKKINEFASENNCSVFSVFSLALATYISKVKITEDPFFIGTTILNRHNDKELNTAGVFINTVPLLFDINSENSFSSNLEKTEDNLMSVFRHQKYTYNDLMSDLRKENKGYGKLYDVMINYMNATIEFTDECIHSSWYHNGMQVESLQIHIDDRDNEGIFKIHYDYQTEKFTESDIDRLHSNICALLEDALTHPDKKISEISIVSEEEREKLFSFNDTFAEYERDKCIHELFEANAVATPDKVALVACDKTLTYKELNEEANKIAHSLIAMGIGNGDIVGLMLPRKSYLLAALLGILKSGAAYLPIDSELPAERIEYMCQDAGAALVVSPDNIDALLNNSEASNPDVKISNDSLCYCIYTSGSTGLPKGVMAKHRNVVNYVSKNKHNIAGKIITEDFETIVSISTCSFDIFITETILPLVNGLRFILADEQQCRNQYALNKLLSKEKGEFLQTTPTKFKVLTAEPTQRDFLRNVKAILLGGEAMEESYLKELRKITNAKIYNIYGATEVPIWSTIADTDTFTDAITIGKPFANTRVYILDKHLKPVPIGVAGELCIGGDSVSGGYLNRPELTAEKFIDNPFTEGKLYRTGDNAYWRGDGNLVYIGRSDFQVKIRGLRIELGEIESAIQAIEGIKRAVVVVRKDKSDRQLICAFYTGEEKKISEIKGLIGSKLPKYMIPHIFTRLEEMPLTTSGKANRNALPEIDLENIGTDTEYVAPETDREIILAESIGNVLESERVSVLDNFFDIGGDSLKAIELTAKLEEKGYTVAIRTIFSCKDIRELAARLEAKETEEEKIEYGNVLPATAAQMRVYTAQMLKPESTLYNITYAFRAENTDKQRLEAAVNGLIARHESLRTRFENRQGTICQIIDSTAYVSVEEAESINSFARPFELDKSPLIRVGCNEESIVIDMHHIIVDGESMPVFFRELNELYMGREIKEDAVQYGEFAVTDGYTKENESYWLDVFSTQAPSLELPCDRQRPAEQSFDGAVYYGQIDIGLHGKIEEKCKEAGITPYVYYMACLSVLLSKLSGSEDIVIGTPISGRQSRFLDAVGMFVNTIALRSRPDGNKTISELLNEIRDGSIEAIDNQNYPFGELVKKLGIEQSGRNPMFDIMLAYQSFELTDISFADKKAELIPLEISAAKCDITFNILPRKDDVVLAAEYCTAIFTEEKIGSFSDMYIALLEQCLDDEQYIKDVSVTDVDLIDSFNNTAHTYDIPYGSTLYSLFEKTAKDNSDKVCIGTAEKAVTFGELLDISEALDARLREITDNKKSVVAVIAERSIEMYGAVYGIIRGGNAYLPIDPSYPADRIGYILSDSNAAAVVAQGKFTHLAGNVPCVDMTELLGKAHSTESVPCLAEADDTAYVIYTSGSTGNPKGARVSHKSAVNRIMWIHDKYPLGGNDVILQKTPYTFDVSVWELFWWGAVGGSLAASKPDEHFLPEKILLETEKNKVTHIHFVPSVFELFLNYLESHREEAYKFGSVKYVFLSGEALSASLVQRFYKLFSCERVTVHNLYGPTECAVDVTYYDCTEEEIDPVPIGKPIYNTQLHIVDKYMNLVPIGVQGEICIAGMNVGQGYLNNEKFTNERFIDNPFGEGKLYRTGDLGYWKEDGNIVFVGRNDFQVKVRGLRIELGEIENAVSEVEGIALSVAVVREDNQGRQFICAFYTGKEVESKLIKAQLSEKLPKYMIPNIFVRLEEMPLTTSGKINRKALPEVDLESIETLAEYIAPETDKEKILADCISEVLGAEKISVADNFFDIGGDSLKAIELSARLEAEGYEIRVKDIFESGNIRELAEKLEENTREYVKAEYGSVLPATAAQMRVYTAQMLKPESTLYNITYAFRAENTDKQRLEAAVNGLIARHESLRTRFENRQGTICQIIDSTAYVSVEEAESINSFARPFELDKSPLIRVGCNEESIVIDMHHIIVDGESMPVFFRELNELYMGREIKEDAVQYGEFAVTDGYTKENESYWLDVFSTQAPSLELPCDRQRLAEQSFDGAVYYGQIDKALHGKIEEKCRQSGITPYIYYMACLSVLLSKLSGSEDIVIGTPISGRQSRFLNTVGMFVNTIALRSRPEGEKTFGDLLGEIRESSVCAIDNQNYPFGELVKKLGIEQSGRNPMFDIMLAYQSFELTDISFADKKAELIPLEISAAKCDITFNILPRKDDVVLAAEYCTDLFKEEKILSFTDMYISLLEKCLDSERYIRDVSVTCMKQLEGFNKTAAEYPEDKCIHELFEAQAEKTPEKTALIAVDKTLTYRALNEEANRIAHSLIGRGIGRGDTVGLMLPRKSYLLSALFGILKTGAAYLPIDSELPEERIEYMCKDADAGLVVSEENIVSLLSSDNIANPCKEITPEAVCYCIYTSGSTGQPKGVLAKHRNVVNYISKNEHNIAGKIIKDDFEAIVSISTCSFDIFVTETVLPLVNGWRTVLADEQQCRNQYALNKLLSKEKGEFLQTTPTKLKVLLSDPAQRGFMSNIRALLLGGEAMELPFLYELRKLTDAKIYNIYGATEVPIWSTIADTETFTDAVTIGKPFANTQVYILDKYLKPVPVGVAGELCIGGDSVSGGYLNRPELTAEKFIDNPFGEGKLYRTGDNAYWREDGNLAYIGRSDFQVKIRGLRIELGEIESAIQRTDGINRAVVVVRRDKEDRQLICAFYTGEEKKANQLREELGKSLPKYMIPHIFTHLAEMPLTASGKANRNALPEIDLENISTETEYVAPSSSEEAVLAECAGVVLGHERVSVLDNFFDIGGDSLKAIELTAKLEERGYTVIIKDIFSSRNIRELAARLEEKETEEIKTEYGNVLPATAAQMRAYTAQMMQPDSTMYNITYAFRAEQLNKTLLERAVNRLIERHESLRTRFENRDGEIMQIIEERAEISVEDISDTVGFAKAFDLSRAPLIRVGCTKDSIVIDIHHIVIDGESMPVFFRELNELYMGRELPEAVQYGEFAVTDGYTQENESYWLRIFEEEAPVSEIPADYPRGAEQSFRGSNIYEQIDINLHREIEKKSKKKGITPYVYYMACLSVLLSKLSGNEDIVTGTPISGRQSRYLNTVGMFVNTVALRSKPEGNKTISELLDEIRASSVDAISNQSYPFGKLLQKVNANSSGRNTMFNVMLAYQSFEMTDITFADKKAELIPLLSEASKCDMSFNVLPRRDDVILSVEYCTDLFRKETVSKFVQMYCSLLEQCLDDDKYIKDISVRDTVLTDSFNNTEHSYAVPESSTVYSLFERVAKENKDKVCIVADKKVTFGELVSISEALDAKIRRITSGEKSVVAVIAERSIEMYAAIYGIIRGGNAYLPIDPDYPQDRINYILSNSGAAAVVSQGKFVCKAEGIPCVDMTGFIRASEETTVPECSCKPEDTAYVIYTSGSTGAPKGAKVSHKSVINRILWMHDKYPLEKDDVILQKTPYTFDVSVWELFWWGMVGGRLAASRPGEHFLPARILDEVAKNKATHLHFVPSVFELFLNYLEAHIDERSKFDSVKYVFLSGEALSANLVQRFYGLYDYGKVTLHNLYGPTECTVDVTYYDCVPADTDPVPIGKPVYNTQMYVVDRYNNIVPVGVTGELCIAGINVGQGYLNNERLTNERFIDNPFGEGKLYRTGDLAYWKEDGNIVFTGRKDSQIKLNGQRVEISEIEAVISSVESVESVAVLLRSIKGRDVLVAFYSGKNASDEMIKNVCREKLPKYMVPSFAVQLEHMPLNKNGKLDRRALADMEFSVPEAETDKPANDLERYICGVFEEILDERNIGRNSDFFELGGTSYSMISLLTEEGFENVSAADFMRNPTPAALADMLSKKAFSTAEYLEGLYVPENPGKALIILPFAGGGAEAFGNFVASLKKVRSDVAVYYIRYLRSFEECKNAADEISVLLKDMPLMFYSHCVGSAVALQIILQLENMGVPVAHYFAGASIPPKKPTGKSIWNNVPDKIIKSILVKSGAELKRLDKAVLADVLRCFRKDTDFAVSAFSELKHRIVSPVTVVVSKTDPFTRRYKAAEKIWSRYAQNISKVEFISTDSHYFQSTESDELADIVLKNK